MNEEILDLRFAICDLGTFRRRYARGGHYGSQFICFLIQGGDKTCFQESSTNNQFHPVRRFVRFFLHGSKLRDELGFRPSPTRGPVICSNRGSTTNQLATYSSSLCRSRQRPNKLYYPQSKSPRSFFQFCFLHAEQSCSRKQQSQSANHISGMQTIKAPARSSVGQSQIANLKSQINAI